MADCSLIGRSLVRCHLIQASFSNLKRQGGTESFILLPQSYTAPW